VKNYKIKYADRALEDLQYIIAEIAWDNPDRAITYKEELKKKIETLSSVPNLGRFDEKNKCFYLYKKPYLIYYDINEEAEQVDIVAVWHSRRQQIKLK